MTCPNVALFPSAFAPHIGGVEELSRRLAIELRSRGSDTVVLTHRYPSDLPARESMDGIPVARERFRIAEPRPRPLAGFILGTLPTRRAVADVIREHRSQIVHVECVSNNAYYAALVARQFDLPFVVSLQGELTMDAGQAYQRSATVRRIWRQVLRSADFVTGCSQQVIDEAVAEFGGWLKCKATVVRNGLNLEAVRAATPEQRDRPYILGIGRHVPQKGFDVLIEAFRKIEDEFPDIDLVLAGDGVEHERLRQLASGSRVELIGAVPSERAFELFRGATAFVLSSRHEPQGIVVVEAMAAGVPVLATAVGGVPETVRDDVNGLLIPGENATAMADGLRRILAHPAAARQRAAQAAIDVADYSWSHITDQYEECYDTARERHATR